MRRYQSRRRPTEGVVTQQGHTTIHCVTYKTGYIERVATAYRDGFYNHGGTKYIAAYEYGDGRFSNLNAVVAAILLDQEATSSTLDADPVYGGIKEPILKVLQFMRAMGYRQMPHDRNIYPKLYDMRARVGQMVHDSPDQFSFFLPGESRSTGRWCEDWFTQFSSFTL